MLVVVSARPQDYDDYDQPAARPPVRPNSQKQQQNYNQQQQQQQTRKNDDRERETSTYIPIIHYDKEQDIHGSYKTQ